MHACRAPGKAREVRIMGAKRNHVVLVLLSLGVVLLWRTHALLTLAIGVVVGAHSPLAQGLRMRSPQTLDSLPSTFGSWHVQHALYARQACMILLRVRL